MPVPLQKNLRDQLEKKKVTAYALEKHLGLKFSAIYNILQGKSKKPSADLILSIAQALECSVEELLQEKKENFNLAAQESHQDLRSAKWVSSLYVESLNIIDKILKERKLELPKTPYLQIVEEVYIYSLEGGVFSVDEKFARWLINRYLTQTSQN